MEKRRRARINASLTELKSLLLEAIKKEGARQNKMEKADILEMAVKHLRHIQRQQFTGQGLGESQLTGESSSEASEVSKYHLGFHACVQEVCKYLDSTRDEDVELKTKLLNHLANCMTSADYPTTAAASASSSMVSSSSSSSLSSYIIQVPVSPTSTGPISPLSPGRKEGRVDSSTVKPGASPRCDTAPAGTGRNALRPKVRVSSDAVQRSATQSASEGILHAVLTSPANSVFVKPNVVSLSTSGNLLDMKLSPGDRAMSSSNGTSSHNPNMASGRSQPGPVTEINNNSIILPALVNMAAPTTFTCIPQPNQLQQPHVYQQQQQQQQQQLQHHLIPTLTDGSSIFTSTNPVQLIPTKTINGDIAFLMSTTNVMNSSHIPSFSIPILTQPAVGHAQILAPPIPQQAIQIAVSYPPDDQQQPMTFIAHSVQPVLQSANPSTDIINSSISNLLPQNTPLNLSSTNQPQQTTPQLLPKQAVAFPKASENADHSLSSQTYTSSPSAVYQTRLSNNSYHASISYSTKSPQAGTAQLLPQGSLSPWSVTRPTESVSLALVKPAESLQSDSYSTARDTDSLPPTHSVDPQNAADKTHPPTSKFFFRPWKE